MSVSVYEHSPLTDRQLAEKVKKGDGGAFEELALRYLRNIIFIAGKYNADGYERGDFIQEGLIGLLYACRTYDENGSASFKSYVDIIVERRFISIVRRDKAKKAVPDSSLVGIEALDELGVDGSQNPEELLLCRERLSQTVEKLRRILSDTEYRALFMYCGGCGYRQIARKLGVSAKAVDNALQRARRKIHNLNVP